MKFEVVLSREAARTLGKLTPSLSRRVLAAMEKLRSDPQKGKRLHGELEGLFRLRVGGMRVVYETDLERNVVIVHAVGPRGDVYKN
ncbi:MAG: type II toxin-antitoxin system RelE/ParE family toxin [Dehalococcoidia bacterium]|nr:type II toxin-antitoxin system RelE/ParE family toxin [Dehalococcoidia bacterium]